ncbi:protein kinase, cAMP-dependent, catalytic chain [Reticulomyxa filosa]|uniref:Protein kinase, cAMP-dependent, catalytic chain n=1 Tax=Reticulomyxa filosa TaxID=46433 RepID=X6M6B9_RETFI|nr:protein kinase, cAMP-dependent, catalytic chain [Reticulomyxa filosa]|eukprot:ETO08575.1 protein kinase, cAMP-dependent, catalytic chain [Reticulomyxa filosa]
MEYASMTRVFNAGDVLCQKWYDASQSTGMIRSARAQGVNVKLLRIAYDDFRFIMATTPGSNICNCSDLIDGNLPCCFANRVPFQLQDFQIVDFIGYGSFGQVSLVREVNTKRVFALKEISKHKVAKKKQFHHIMNEKKVMSVLDSPFCVKLNINLFLQEMVLGGELHTLLRHNRTFDEENSRFYGACVLLAFEHIHSKDIIYRDLKPENLLIDRNGYLAITDFGFAKKRNITTTLCGTGHYLAPELIHGWVQGFAVDWWTLGVLMYEMVVGHPPFEDDEQVGMYQKIIAYNCVFPKSCSAEFQDLIEKLLEKNCYRRLGSIRGAQEIKRHSFFKVLKRGHSKKKIFRLKKKKKEFSKLEIPAPYVPTITCDTDLSNFEKAVLPQDKDRSVEAQSFCDDWIDGF